MKCILLFVGVLAILALTQAEDEAAPASLSSEPLDSEAAIPAEPEQGDENQNHQHEHGHGHHSGKPPKRTPVFGFGINFESGK